MTALSLDEVDEGLFLRIIRKAKNAHAKGYGNAYIKALCDRLIMSEWVTLQGKYGVRFTPRDMAKRLVEIVNPPRIAAARALAEELRVKEETDAAGTGA